MLGGMDDRRRIISWHARTPSPQDQQKDDVVNMASISAPTKMPLLTLSTMDPVKSSPGQKPPPNDKADKSPLDQKPLAVKIPPSYVKHV